MLFTNRVIVNADDFGLHESINNAIAVGHSNGIVTSASLLPADCALAFEDALTIIQSLPNLDVGLHFTLVGAEGLPRSFKEFFIQKLAGRFPASTIEDLLRRQLDSLLSRNVKVTHIDSHQHLHGLPSIMSVVAKVASEYRIGAVRLPRESSGYFGATSGRIGAAKVLDIFANVSKAYLDRYRLSYTDHFAGMAVSGGLTSTILAQITSNLRPGTTEIICHPGTSNAELAEVYDWGYNWERELRAVTNEDNRSLMNRWPNEPYSFSRLVSDDRAKPAPK